MIQVQNLQDVQKFAEWLIDEKDVVFHPDTPFSHYVTSDNSQFFSDKECKKLETILTNCWEICNKNEVDIYDLMCEVAVANLKRKGVFI